MTHITFNKWEIQSFAQITSTLMELIKNLKGEIKNGWKNQRIVKRGD